MAVVAKNIAKYHIKDKCNPPCEMGNSIVFADALPGLNDTRVRPFGWTEYESAYRHQYIPDPCPANRPCENKCRAKGDRGPRPREFVNPRATVQRQNICGLCQKAKCCCPIPPPWEECREKVRVYDPDSVRTLLVHGEVKNEHPFVISHCDYNRILTNAIVRDKEEKEREEKERQRLRRMKICECKEVADEMRLQDSIKFNDSISPEIRDDMDETLCRAAIILQEDEPEVRTINKLILGAKVSAIREAQLQEKELIKCEISEEDRRLNQLMKQDAKFVLIKDPEEELAIQHKKKVDLMASIQAQLDEHEALKFLKKERQEAEYEQMKRIWEAQDMDDMQRKALERERRNRLGLELIENQILQVERQRREKEYDRDLDEKILEWQRQKDEEMEKIEAEKKAEKKRKDLAILQMLETQQKVGDAKAIRDELRAKRHQEKQEREWRNLERDTIIKKHRDAEELKKSILGQIDAKHEWVIEQATFDKAVYDKILNVQDARLIEEQKAEEDRKERNAQYRYDLREQIHQYQLSKIKERKEHFCEGITLRKNLRRRDHELRCYMDKKLAKLRDHQMPEKYIKHIERAIEDELRPEWGKSVVRK